MAQIERHKPGLARGRKPRPRAEAGQSTRPSQARK
jgi:hypothetical protein